MSLPEPPAYPRVPHLVAGRGSSDDQMLDATGINTLLSNPVLVEEKLDGANVVVWLAGGGVKCALRSGFAGMDRARQLGPLRAWLAERHDAVATVLGDVRAIYTEWLLLTHTVAYDRLESYLVLLDVFDADAAMATIEQRNGCAAAAGLPTPPLLHRGLISGGVNALESMLVCSKVGAEPMEGLVIRTLDGSPRRVAKLVRPGFILIGEAQWRAGRPHNSLRQKELSWH